MYGSIYQDGMKIADRFTKAVSTILAKHEGDVTKATAEINGLARYKFGLTKSEYDVMVEQGHFGKLAIQKNRHEHQLAQEREAAKGVKQRHEEAKNLMSPMREASSEWY